MRPFTSTIPFDEALRRLADAAAPVTRTERVGLTGAAGRVIAERVTSTLDVPPFARAAMDGYAVRADDVAAASTSAPISLSLVGAVYTGEWPARGIGAGECMEIATGAPIPDGADAVVMVERTSREHGSDAARDDRARVFVHEPVDVGRNIGPRGSDITAGAVVLEPGAYLTPGRVGALAAVGCHDLLVYARPRVGLFSTGNEVVAPGQALRPGTIYDVNAAALPPIVELNGGAVVEHRRVPDDVDATAAALRFEADLVVVTGGSSVGERDLVVDAVAACGGEIVFHGIAVKPGKPTLLARMTARTASSEAPGGEASRLVLGLPGNPASCLSNAYILLVPLLRAMAQLPAHRPERRRARLARRVASVGDRHQFYTVRLEGGMALPAFKGSGDITSLSQADGYFEIPVGVEAVERDAEIEVILF